MYLLNFPSVGDPHKTAAEEYGMADLREGVLNLSQVTESGETLFPSIWQNGCWMLCVLNLKL